jgi:hypothetical protein
MGLKGGLPQAIGRLRGGLTSKDYSRKSIWHQSP